MVGPLSWLLNSYAGGWAPVLVTNKPGPARPREVQDPPGHLWNSSSQNHGSWILWGSSGPVWLTWIKQALRTHLGMIQLPVGPRAWNWDFFHSAPTLQEVNGTSCLLPPLIPSWKAELPNRKWCFFKGQRKLIHGTSFCWLLTSAQHLRTC